MFEETLISFDEDFTGRVRDIVNTFAIRGFEVFRNNNILGNSSDGISFTLSDHLFQLAGIEVEGIVSLREFLVRVDDVSPVDLRIVVMSFNEGSSGLAECLDVVSKSSDLDGVEGKRDIRVNVLGRDKNDIKSDLRSVFNDFKASFDSTIDISSTDVTTIEVGFSLEGLIREKSGNSRRSHKSLNEVSIAEGFVESGESTTVSISSTNGQESLLLFSEVLGQESLKRISLVEGRFENEALDDTTQVVRVHIRLGDFFPEFDESSSGFLSFRLCELVQESNVDGTNGDTRKDIPFDFFESAERGIRRDESLDDTSLVGTEITTGFKDKSLARVSSNCKAAEHKGNAKKFNSS